MTLAQRLHLSKTFLRDLGERVFWTAAEVVIGYVSIDQVGLPKEYVPVATILLAAVKGIVARHIGDSNSAGIPAPPIRRKRRHAKKTAAKKG